MKNGPRNESRTHGVGFADRSVDRFAIRGKNSCKAGFLPANHTRVNGFRFCRYAIFVGGVRRPIRVPLLRFRSTGHDRQGPRAVVGPSEFPSDLSTPRRLTPTRRIQGTSSKLLAQIKATEGFAPPYPPVPWNRTAMVARLRRTRTVFRASQGGQPLGGLAFLVCHVAKELEPPVGFKPTT